MKGYFIAKNSFLPEVTFKELNFPRQKDLESPSYDAP